MKEKFIIDASNRSIGRVASEAAGVLMGKYDTGFMPNKVSLVLVEVQNAAKLSIDHRKSISKMYYRHSGYIGNLKKKSLKETAEKDIGLLLRRTVSHMLPDNRLRKARLENLKIDL